MGRWWKRFAAILAGLCLFAPTLAKTGPPASAASPKKDATVGVGISFGGPYPTVQFVIPDTPAGRSGKIHPDDLIVAVGQGNEAPVTIERLPAKDVLKLIRGPKGTVVTLKILPDGKQMADAVTVSLTRGAFEGQSRFGDGNFLAPGTRAPRLKAESLIPGGPDFELKGSRDRFVVLVFWGQWRAGSTEQIDLAQRVADQYPEWSDRVQIVAVSVDDDKDLSWKRFGKLVRQWDDITPVWTGPSVLKQFHIDTVSTVYVLDPQLKVIAADHCLELARVLKQALERPASKN